MTSKFAKEAKSHPKPKQGAPTKAHAKKAGAAKVELSSKEHGFIHKIHRSLVECHTRCKQRAAVSVAAPNPNPGWFSGQPDTKTPLQVSDPYAEFKALAAASRDAVRSMLGMKAMRFRLPVTTSFSSTITTGLVSAVLALDISLSPEFASLAALFDEYKFEGGRLDFVVTCPTPTQVLGTSGLTSASSFAIGYDPADASVATNVRDILQLEQHKQLFPRMVATPTVGTYVGVFGAYDNRPATFNWKCARLSTLSGNGGAVAPGMWKSTQGNVSSFPDGTIKPFYLSGETTVKDCMNGTMYWDVLFRSRT